LRARRPFHHCHNAESATIIAVATTVASAVSGIGKARWIGPVTAP